LDPIKEEIVSDLVVVELVEVIMPLAYAISVLTAYYGPNGEIIGNIKNSYWSYTAIQDLGKLLVSIFQMFAIDFVSLAFGWVVLWKLSLLNCVREGCKALKGYIPHISITLSGAVVKYFMWMMVAGGVDFTFQFNWITEERKAWAANHTIDDALKIFG